MDERIRVVSAAIVWRPDGAPPRLLLGQRGPKQAFPLAWCTPGGKVEKGEPERDALERELAEELDICVFLADTGTLGAFLLDPPAVARPVALTIHVVEGLSPSNRFGTSDELIGFGWFTAEELQRLPLTPGDRAALPALVKLLGGTLARPTISRTPQEDGYVTAERELSFTPGSARLSLSAKERGLYPDDQDAQAEWDRGYSAACAAYRPGNNPAGLSGENVEPQVCPGCGVNEAERGALCISCAWAVR